MNNFLEYLRTNKYTLYEGLAALDVVDTATNIMNLTTQVEQSNSKIKDLEKQNDQTYDQLLQVSRELNDFEKATNTNFTVVNTKLSALSLDFQSHVKNYENFVSFTVSSFNRVDDQMNEIADWATDLEQRIESQTQSIQNLESNYQRLENSVNSLTEQINNIVIEPVKNRFGHLLKNNGKKFSDLWIWVVIESPHNNVGDIITPGTHHDCKITGVGHDYKYYGGTGTIVVDDMEYPSAVQNFIATTDYFSGQMLLNPT